MILTKPLQQEFFECYFPLLYYASVYGGVLPEGSLMTDLFDAPMEAKVNSRDVLFTDEKVIDDFLRDNKKILSKKQVEFAKNLKNGVLGEFVVLKEYTDYTVLMKLDDSNFYEVINITERFNKLVHYIPSILVTALFNFHGKIICDELIAASNIAIGPNNTKIWLHNYEVAKTENKVINLF